jgi:AraC-like DNA-binding protein
MGATQLTGRAPSGGEAVDEQVTSIPAPGLRSLIAGYTGYRQAGLAPARHRGMPSPYLTVIFTLDEPLTIARHPDPAQPPEQYDTLTGGLHTAPALITHDGWQSGIQLAVSPLAARALLGLPAGELAGLDVDGAAVLGPLASQIQQRLQAAASWPDRFAVLDELLLARVGPGQASSDCPGVREEVGHVWRRLLAAGGRGPVAGVAAETGWSDRHLRSQFRAETGLTPKAAARVIRFDRARLRLLRQVRAGARPSLADLAVTCGYYDQAHLDREFGALAGCPPTTWLAEMSRRAA